MCWLVLGDIPLTVMHMLNVGSKADIWGTVSSEGGFQQAGAERHVVRTCSAATVGSDVTGEGQCASLKHLLLCYLPDVAPAVQRRSNESVLYAGDVHTQDTLEHAESIGADHAYVSTASILAVRALECAQHRSGRLATESIVLSANDLIRNTRQSVEARWRNALPHECSCAISPGVHQRGKQTQQTRGKASGKGGHIGPCRTKWQCPSHDNYCL